jgi:hypothetical protein
MFYLCGIESACVGRAAFSCPRAEGPMPVDFGRLPTSKAVELRSTDSRGRRCPHIVFVNGFWTTAAVAGTRHSVRKITKFDPVLRYPFEGPGV